MSDDRSPFEGNRPPASRMSDEPAVRKPLKLPNTPINGFGMPEDSATEDTDTPMSGGTIAGTPLSGLPNGFDLLEMEQREQQNLTRLRDLMRVLVRALKAKRMYPANNPLLQRILAEASIGMNETLELLGDIRLTVSQFDFLFLGQSIYSNPNKKESIAFRFAKDGITELVFQEGLPPEQLEDFLTVLGTALESSALEDDLVTLLWEQEFSHISYAYLAIDDMQENSASLQANADEAMSWPEGSDAESLDEATGVPWTDHQGWVPEDGGSGHRADDWNELVPVARVEDRCSNDFLHLTSQEIEALAEEIHREHSRSLHDVVLEILTEVAEDEPTPEAFADLARAFADLLIVVIHEADLRLAVEIVATLKTLSASRGHDPMGFLPDPRDLATQALSGLGRHPEADSSLLPEFLVHLGPRAIDPVCDLLVDVDVHALHGALQLALVELARIDIKAIRSRIETAPPHAARAIVQVLAQVGGQEAEQALAAATSHVEARVRKEAIAALAQSARGTTTRPYLLRALDDDDVQVRAAALFAVRESFGQPEENSSLAERLLVVLGGPRFADQSAVERGAYFDALVTLGGPTVIATLEAWAGLWSLGGTKDMKARRELAAGALARMSDPAAQAALRKLARSFIPAVRGTSRRALSSPNEEQAA
jgi:hypothetical protein